jgi:hypothetical protein
MGRSPIEVAIALEAELAREQDLGGVLAARVGDILDSSAPTFSSRGIGLVAL